MPTNLESAAEIPAMCLGIAGSSNVTGITGLKTALQFFKEREILIAMTVLG